MDEWVGAIGLNVSEYGTHSMRRTKASLIYKATGNLRAAQIPLGHTNIENTVRYMVSISTTQSPSPSAQKSDWDGSSRGGEPLPMTMNV